MKLSAEFQSHVPIGQAVEALAAAGFERSSIALYSFQPVELSAGALDRPSRMSLFAVAGAILSGGSATAWMFWTQHDYPLVTGGMPISSGWATGVITFETTMAGAVAGILAAFLIESGMFSRRAAGPRPALDTDTVFLELPCAQAEFGRAEQACRAAGAIAVRRLEDAEQ